VILRRFTYVHFSLRLVTLLLPLIAFAGAAYVRFAFSLLPSPVGDVDSAPYFGMLVFTTLVWAIAAEHFGLMDVEGLFAAGGKTRRLLSACAVTYASITTATFFYRGITFSRLFVLLGAVFLFFLTGLTRLAFRVLLNRSRQGRSLIRILIIGADRYAGRAASLLLAGQVMPCRLVGFVRLGDQTAEVRGSQIFELNQIQELADTVGIDDVVISLPPSRWDEISVLIKKLEFLCVPIRATLDFGDGVIVRDKLHDLGAVMMLDIRTTPAESIPYLIVKRIFDIGFSIFAMIVTAPIMLLMAITIRFSSKGRILFVQERVGLNGRKFKIYKFRTMRAGEDATESDTRWTTRQDPRRTAFGAFLRRMNLDELPQFYNVLKGDMSVVGPRPERPYFVQKFLLDNANYNTRHYLKAGITGWAQVNGLRGDTSISKRLEYDLYYLQHWSFTFDLQIVLLTFLRMFSSQDAY
jgi:exopolysaccharide biosynthesis polyprenyl glycosylphosphotransferase